MRRPSPERTGKFTAIPAPHRMKAHRKKCQVCGQAYDKILSWVNGGVIVLNEHIHHLIPRRWLNEHGIFEHSMENLLSICNYCHGKAKVIEDCLWHGDLLGFLSGMRRINFPVEKIVAFALSVGLEEFGRITP